MDITKKLPIIIQTTNKLSNLSDRNFRLIAGKTVLEFLITRLREQCDGEIVVATSILPEDDIIEEKLKPLGVHVFRGDHENLPLRLLSAVSLTSADDFIRLNANHPLVDIDRMKEIANIHIKNNNDLTYNGHLYGDVWGTECEIINVNCLKKILDKNFLKSQLDTFSFFIRQNSSYFKVMKVNNKNNIKRPNYKVALETEKDLKLINDIVRNVNVLNNDNIIHYLDNHLLLAESNLDSPAKEVGLEKIYIHTGKLEQLVNPKTDVDTSYPISVELSLTNRCNLECIYCSDQNLREKQGWIQFEKQTIFNLLSDLRQGGTKGVVIEGGGEPCLHPNFNEIVKYAKDIGLAVGLITNGTVALDETVLSAFEWIRVSLDASTPKEYCDLKKADVFERVMSNIFNYTKHCETVGVGFVVTKNNVSELEALVLRLRDYNVSYIQFRPVVDCAELYPHGEDLSYMTYYQTSNFGIIIDGMSENAERGNWGLSCTAHSLTTVIAADGSVYICGRLNIYSWIKPIGNINSASFYDIWNGEERRKQSNMVKNKEFCMDNCPQCRISKFNKLIINLSLLKTKNFI